MGLQDYFDEMDQINLELYQAREEIGSGLPTREQLNEIKRLTKQLNDVIDRVPTFFGSQQ